MTHSSLTSQSENEQFAEDISAISTFMKFCERIKLDHILATVPDHRDKRKTKYSKISLMKWVLTTFFCRCESKNAMNTTISDLPPDKQAALTKYLEVEGKFLPKRDCVDDFLASLKFESINDMFALLFQQLSKSKLFYNHAESLLPNNNFHLSIDGFWVHKYAKPHSKNACGENNCPYCLPRVHNKGQPDERIEWLHVFVTFVLVFPGGLTLPIYVYPLKASQVDTTANDEKLKQECELLCAHKVLPKLIPKLGRQKITVVLDSLYANEPMINLLESFNLKYLIVRQDRTFKSIGRKCDEFDTSELYQKNCRDKQIKILPNGSTVEETARWYNDVACGKKATVNVLRFSEITKDSQGNIVKEFQTEWLGNTTIQKGNWHSLVKRARLRSYHEDMHNSLKNRGFAAEHDFARANPNLSVIWKFFMYVAYFLYKVFSFTVAAKREKGKRSWMKFAKDLLEQLIRIPWEKLSCSPIFQKSKVQFRYDFALY